MDIPASLIIVFLVGAWLAVLVPMVARRREQVPETETDGGTFRVLRRASASMRRRPKLGRRDDLEEDDIAEDMDSEDPLAEEPLDEEPLDEELLDGEDDESDDDEFGESRFEHTEFEHTEFEHTEFERTDTANESESVRVGGWKSGGVRAGRRSETVAMVATESHETDARATPIFEAPGYLDDDDYSPGPPIDRLVKDGRRLARDDRLSHLDEANLRPIPRRPGRGGFDPDAAEAARAYRYSRRRRITVILLFATIAFSVAAYLFKPVLWSGTALFGLLLVAYLGYLRRQVRIENNIRERRLARLRRARQIRPEYQSEHLGGPATGGSLSRDAVAVSQVPVSGYRRGREVVDLEDDDPSFDDLEYYQPAFYRRASGQ